MSVSVASRIFLRAAIPRLRVTAVRCGSLMRDDGAITIGQRLAWAACLAEFEQVEVYNLTRGQRLICHLRFGADGRVEVAPSAASLMQPGDHVRISAYAWIPPDAVEGHSAVLVIVDEHNSVIEFRRMTPRPIRLDPFSFPPPPAIDVMVAVSPSLPADAMD